MRIDARGRAFRGGAATAVTLSAAVAGLVTVTGPTATAAAAGAPTLSVTQSCFVNTIKQPAPITITGSGWTPGDEIDVNSSDGLLYTPLTADANGNISGSLGSDIVGDGVGAKTVTLTATDEGSDTNPISGGPTASTVLNVANFWAQTSPTVARPKRKVTWSFSGFTARGPIYGHFLHGKKLVGTYRFGKPTGACGVLKTRARMYPVRGRAFQHYTIQLDNSKRYRAKTKPQLRIPFQLLTF